MLFRPRDRKAPAMTLEGVLGPNARLDEAEGMSVDAPDALCVAGDGRLLLSSGESVLAMSGWGDEPVLWHAFDAPVTTLCASPHGLVGVGLADGGFEVRDSEGKIAAKWAASSRPGPVCDGTFVSEDEIALVQNGYGPSDDFLSLAPWHETARGRVLSLQSTGESKEIAGNLHCPMGIASDIRGLPFVSLLEHASIVGLAGETRQSGFPAYIGRIRLTPSGYLISCLARRDALIEFLKTETAFVEEMKKSIAPRHWLSPRINPEFSHEFPIELGATRLFGDVKPWAPSFSYGLIIQTDENLIPIASAHSRANGARHAISDALVWNGTIVAVSRASGELLCLSWDENA